MNQFDSADLDRITQYVADALPVEEREAVAEWITADPQRHALVQRLRNVASDARMHRAPYVDAAAVARNLEARLADERLADSHLASESGVAEASFRTPKRGSVNRATPSRRSWMAIRSAALAGVVLVAGITHFTRRDDTAATTTAHTTYRTQRSQQARVSLRDGSIVTLAPQSVLHIAGDFGSGERRVRLEGEAYFEVTGMEDAPFVVQSGNVDTRVLGTRFIVRRYADDEKTRVSVTDGKVLVTANTVRAPSVTLTAGVIGSVTDSSATATEADQAEDYAAWIDGRLVFKEAQTADILKTLSRWHGYTFECPDSSLARTRLTVWLSTESTNAAIATLKLVLNANAVMRDSTVMFIPKKDGMVKHQPHSQALPAAVSQNTTQRREFGR